MSKITVALALMAIFMPCAECSGQSTSSETPPLGKGISAQERQALAALHEATDGSHWKNHEGWLGPVGSECTWHGVQCVPGTSEATTVVYLELLAARRGPCDVIAVNRIMLLTSCVADY